jgi:hypothetical protein
MTTAVKIYREPENESLIMGDEELSEYNSIALELGLQTKENVEQEKVPNVYLCLNTFQKKSMKVLCPSMEEISKYKRTTIPLEVLRVYKFAKEHEMFEGFQIWYNDTKPDPLLIGWKFSSEEAREKEYIWQKDHFLLARWGDCALELPELLSLAFSSLKEELLDKVKQSIQKCKNISEDPDVYVRKILKGENFDMTINLSTAADNSIY